MKSSLSYSVLCRATVIAVCVGCIAHSSVRAQPSMASNSETTSLGKSIYDARCAMCHGADGKGNGLAAHFLHPRPRDFTAGKFKFRTTESGSIPTDADIQRTIGEGLHGTAMPDWKDFISGDSLADVVTYVKSLSPRFKNEKPNVVTLNSPVPSSPASIEAGRKVYAQLQCESCHGADGAGKDATASGFVDDWGSEISATNLTEPWTFRAGSGVRDIYLRVRTGIDGAPMPSYIGSATDKELWNLANYVASLGRKPIWEMDAEEVRRHYAYLAEERKTHPVEYGKYLVETRGCETCHSTYNDDGTINESLRFAGGMKWSVGPYGVVTSPNLTSDKETGLGAWTDDEIKRGITKGIRKEGTRSIPFPMPWTSYANLGGDDMNAIIAYLRTIPPVYNRIPEPESLDIFSYLWGKFKMLILREDFATFTYPGNAGTTKEGKP